jgi:hypothetical protein
LAAVLVCAATHEVEPRSAAAVELQLYPLTGEVRLFNPDPTDFNFVYYEVKSAANALTGAPAGWKSIADNYDASGNGFVDSVNQWIKLSGTTSEISEALFTGSGSHLPALRSIGLGEIWNPAAVLPNDIAALIVDENLQSIPLPIVISLAGDYNHNLMVDSLDYTLWRSALGSVTTPAADGNFDGIVDAADYTVWRDNFGQNIAGAGYGNLGSGQSSGLVVGGAAPEPTGIALALLASCGPLASRRRRRPSPSV